MSYSGTFLQSFQASDSSRMVTIAVDSGLRPTPQLFLRWVQLATGSPRFSIHSWKPTKRNPSSASNIMEPCTYPSVLSHIQESIKRRYELIPYLYELWFHSTLETEPLQRWVGLGPYDQDSTVWNDPVLRAGERQFFLSDAFVVACMYEQYIEPMTLCLPSCKLYEEETHCRETYYDDVFISLTFAI
jgi:alpha-glucosidase (family GH31 glycosyl hydrolase)